MRIFWNSTIIDLREKKIYKISEHLADMEDEQDRAFIEKILSALSYTQKKNGGVIIVDIPFRTIREKFILLKSQDEQSIISRLGRNSNSN